MAVAIGSVTTGGSARATVRPQGTGQTSASGVALPRLRVIRVVTVTDRTITPVVEGSGA